MKYWLYQVHRQKRFSSQQNKTNKIDFTVSYNYLQYLQSGHTQSQKDSYETLDIVQQQPKLKHIFNRVIDCLLQEGKISQEHSSPRENSFNLNEAVKSKLELGNLHTIALTDS